MAIDEGVDRQQWRDYARHYARLYELVPVRHMLDDVINAGHIRQAQRVLDAGCGPGLLERRLLDGLGHRPPIFGLDLLPEMVEQALRVGYRQFDASVADLSAPASQWNVWGKFDCVAMNNVLYIMDNPTAVLRELLELITPGGRLVVSTAKAEPDMGAVLSAHTSAVSDTPEGQQAEAQWILTELAPIVEINQKWLLQRYRFPDTQAELESWFTDAGWAVQSVTSTYADQNWLVTATRG